MENMPKPNTNREKYFHSMLNENIEDTPKPRSNEELYLDLIAKRLAYLISLKPRTFLIKTTDWTLGNDNRYYYNIEHNVNSQDIIWSAWEVVEGVLTSTVLDSKLTSMNVMQILSDKNTEVKIVINAIV